MAYTLAQIEWVRLHLGVTIPPQLLAAKSRAAAPTAPTGKQPTSVVWREAKELVGEQIGKLQSFLKGVADPLAQRVADQGLNGLTKKLQVGLHVALTEYDQAAPEKKAATGAKARTAVTAFRQFLQTDPALPLLERNPFGVAVSIRPTLGGALDAIEKALAVA